jgi:hypothetical protein
MRQNFFHKICWNALLLWGVVGCGATYTKTFSEAEFLVLQDARIALPPVLNIAHGGDDIINIAENTTPGVLVTLAGEANATYALACTTNCTITAGATGTLDSTGNGMATIQATESGTVEISAIQTDLVGNISIAGTAITTADLVPPTVTIGTPSIADANNTTTVTYAVNYTEAATHSLTAAGVTLNATGNATCSKAVTNGTTPTPIVTLTNCTGNGAVGITIAANTAQDAANNGNAPSAASTPFNVDNTAPTFTSLVLANGAADTTLNTADVAANQVVATLTADNYTTANYAIVSNATTCDSAVTYNKTSIPTAGDADFVNENTYKICVKLTDAAGNTTYGASADNITVNLNDAPTNITLSANSINENNAANAVVGTLSTTDIDVADTHTYSLVAGCSGNDTGNAAFNINSNSLRATNALNFEAQSSYAVCVRTTDNGAGNLTYDKSFTITVNKVNEPPILSYSGSTGTIGTIANAMSVTPTTLNNQGAAVTNCTTSPTLPTGLTINANTCVISGTPTIFSPTTTYTISATNSAGTGTSSLILAVRPSFIPIPPSDLKLRASTTPPSGSGGIYNLRIINDRTFFAAIITGGTKATAGRTNASQFTIAYDAAPATNDIRATIPFQGVNSESYILLGGGSSNNNFRRYSFSMANETSATLPFANTGSHGVDWVNDNTLLFSGYETGTRNRLHLVTVTPDPFSLSVNTLWNSNGYVNSAATRIRDVRVGRFFRTHAYYADSIASYPATAGVYALNLTTGTETKIIDLTNLNSEIYSVVEASGYLFVHTFGHGVFVYKLGDATSIAESLSGNLQTTYYSKSLFDTIASASSSNYAFDVSENLSQMALAYATTKISHFVKNEAPTISDVTNQNTSEDTAITGVTVSIADIDSTITCASLSATSSNTALLPVSEISFTGTIPDCSMSLTPAANQNGTSTVTLTVTDGETPARTAQDTFTLTVNAVNDTPTLITSGETSKIVAESQSAQISMHTASDPDMATNSQTLTYAITANPSHGTLGSAPANGATGGNITYTANANWAGADSFSYTICDNFGTPACTGAVTVNISITDTTPPTVAVGNPSASNANSTGTVTFAVTYTGATTHNLTDSGVTLNTTTGATCNKAVTNGTTATPTVTLTNCTGNGTVGITIAANTAQDPANNNNAASAASTTFVVDNAGPTVSLGSPSQSVVKNGTNVTYTVTFSGGSVFTFDTTDITLNTTGDATCNKAVTNGDTATATVTLSACTGDGTVGITVAAGAAADALGNNSDASSPSTTFAVDNTAPTVATGAPSTSNAKSTATVTFAVTYTGASTHALTANDVTLNTSGGATCNKAVTNGTTATPTVTLTSCTGDGTVGITIGANTAQDAVGNPNLASSASTTFNVDNTPPTVTAGAPNRTYFAESTDAVSFAVTYTGTTTHNLTADDVTLNATGGATCSKAVTNGTTATPTVTLTNCSGTNQTVGITVNASTATDAAGNANSASAASSTFTIVALPATTRDWAFASTRSLGLGITFGRASSATYVGSNGLIQTAAANTPRFDHHPVTQQSLGLLIEETRTNILLHSENMGDAGWYKSGLTITANATTAPDGNTTADRLVESATALAKSIRQTTPGTVSIGKVVTASFYIKPSGRTKAQIRFDNAGGAFSDEYGARFDLTATTATPDAVQGVEAAVITDAGNGWYRCSISHTTNLDNGQIQSVITLMDDSWSNNYLGNGTSGLFVWGAQLEVGAFATSYIPTTTAAATRVEDFAGIFTHNFTAFYNNTEGSVVAEGKTYNAAAVTSGGWANQIFRFDDTTADNNNGFGIAAATDGTRGEFRISSTDATQVFRARPTGGLTKASLAIKANNYNSYVDGLQSTNSTTLGSPFTPTFMYIGSAPNASGTAVGFWNGHISRIRYWNTRLSDGLLQHLTQP